MTFMSPVSESQSQDQSATTNQFAGWIEIQGDATNGLRPSILIGKEGPNWSYELDFLSLTNFLDTSWMKITNRVGAKLQCWQSDGTEVFSTNTEVLDAMHLPVKTTASEIRRSVPHSRWGLCWLRVGSSRAVGNEPVTAASTTFNLADAFSAPFTNYGVLKITPLLYRVDTNMQAAQLVEFPPIKVKLLPDGHVQTLTTGQTNDTTK